MLSLYDSQRTNRSGLPRSTLSIVFGPTHVSFGAAFLFIAALVLASGFAGLLIGDRYQPLGNGPVKASLERIQEYENRVTTLELELQRSKEKAAR